MSAGPEAHCASCGQTEAEVKRLFSARAGGGTAKICSACVESCAQIMADGPTRIPGAAHVCAFCGRSENDVAVMLGVGEAMICDVCVDTYRADDA